MNKESTSPPEEHHVWSCLTMPRPPPSFICWNIRLLSVFYILAGFFLIGKALWIREFDIYYRVMDPQRNHEIMVVLAGLSLMIVAFVNVYSVNNSVPRLGRAIFNLGNVAVLILAMLVLQFDEIKD